MNAVQLAIDYWQQQFNNRELVRVSRLDNSDISHPFVAQILCPGLFDDCYRTCSLIHSYPIAIESVLQKKNQVKWAEVLS